VPDITLDTIRLSVMRFGNLRAPGDLDNTYANLSDDDKADVNRAIEDGCRWFYHPEPVDGVPMGYRWSFMQPHRTITLTAGTGEYTLPSAFQHIVGELTCTAAGGVGAGRTVKKTDLTELNRLRSVSGRTGYPELYAIGKNFSDGTDNQTSTINLYPIPDAAYTLDYDYFRQIDVLETGITHGYGFPEHSHTVEQACIAAYDINVNDASMGDTRYQLFLKRLQASVMLDRKTRPSTIGTMTDPAAFAGVRGGRYYQRSGTYITVNGSVIQ
jgi:hypothetical protein